MRVRFLNEEGGNCNNSPDGNSQTVQSRKQQGRHSNTGDGAGP